MDKRLAKRAKRQADRAKLHKKTSEPDVRTFEQIKAAREASQSGANSSIGAGLNAATAAHGPKSVGTGSSMKTGGE